jgi:hypothetical protein
MIARGVAAILTVRERRHGDRTDGPPRCLRCHRELTGKVPPFRGIGRDCWRAMMRIKATDPDAPTIPTGPDYVVVRDKRGRLHHNVSWGDLPLMDAPPEDPIGFLLAHAIVRLSGMVRREWLPHLAPVFYDEFLRDVPDDGTIIRGSDVSAWIMEHTRRGDA